MQNISAAAFADTKPHYDILDGLRGVAALTVVCFHLFEAYATSHLDQQINHGYLAVDFFFILSGFVVGYAYDDRWKSMKASSFMYPLNGPSWSLFFEYIGNILYVIFIHKLSTKALTALVVISGCCLAIFSIFGPLGDMCVGFSMNFIDMIGGSLRLMFSFSLGLLMSRIFSPTKIKGAFWIAGLAIIAVAAVPRLGGSENLWVNGIYDILCAAVIFPLLVYIGASGKTTDRISSSICKFLGDISYPLYMVHYPFIYLYYAWVKNNNLTFTQSLPGAAAVVIGSMVLAYICLKIYDEPVRKYLTRHLLHIKKSVKAYI